MNDTEQLLANIAKIDYPEAKCLTYKDGSFWACGDGEPQGLFASDTHDKVFAAALWLDDEWVLWLDQPSDNTISKLAALADEKLPDWTLIRVVHNFIYADGNQGMVPIASLKHFAHLKAGDRFTRWNRAAWETAAQ